MKHLNINVAALYICNEADDIYQKEKCREATKIDKERKWTIDSKSRDRK